MWKFLRFDANRINLSVFLALFFVFIQPREETVLLEIVWHSSLRTPSRERSENLFLTVLRCFFFSNDWPNFGMRSSRSCFSEIKEIECVRTCQYRAIVGLYNIPRCISFAIRKATRMESDIIDADYRTRAFSSLIMVRSVPSGSRPVWEFPLEFFGTTGHKDYALCAFLNRGFFFFFSFDTKEN